MRKEKRNAIEVKYTKRVASYHGGSHEQAKYFTSDRYTLLRDVATPKGYGLEIETNSPSISCNHSSDSVLAIMGAFYNEILFKDFPKDLFKTEQDCTISGAECITQVMTKEFIRNHYSAFKNLYDVYMPYYGINCNRGCGMHVNISNAVFGSTRDKQEIAIRKLAYFVNKHYTFSKHLFHRTGATDYCAQMFNDFRNCNIHDFYNSHGVSINLGHIDEGRVELRLVGGQPNFASFRNTMESVFFLIDRVKHVSWTALDDMEIMFTGCNKYVLDRLSYVKNQGCLSEQVYNNIASKSDTETEYL